MNNKYWKDGNIEYISYFTNQNKTENEKVKIEKLVNETFKNKEEKNCNREWK